MPPWNHSRDHLIAEDDRRREEGGWGGERRAGKVTGGAHNLISMPHLNLRISRSRMTLAFSRKWLFGSSLHLITPPINFSRCGDSSDGGRTPIIILMKPNAAFTTSLVCEDSKVHMVEMSWLAMPELSTSEGEGGQEVRGGRASVTTCGLVTMELIDQSGEGYDSGRHHVGGASQPGKHTRQVLGH